jgi:2-oxoglutarate dehydrogenase E2 component (dihydrolipoamide succinyltransferase)
MSIELKIPDVGESIQEVQIGQWLKHEGDRVKQDETLVELDTDKASMELPAPADGVLTKIVKRDGDKVQVGQVIAVLEPAGSETAEQPAAGGGAITGGDDAGEAAVPKRKAPPPAPQREPPAEAERPAKKARAAAEEPGVASPSVRRMLREHNLRASEVEPSGAGGRVLKEDVSRFLEQHPRQRQPAAAAAATEPAAQPGTAAGRPAEAAAEGERIVPMSLLRRRIAARLVEARQQAALLTTFNEIDMSAVIELRNSYRELFQKTYGVKLGFMSFFVKASVDALRQHPVVNAEVRGDNIVYHESCHIGVAIGGSRGLVVPVLRFAERLSFAEVERMIDDFVKRADANKLEPDDLVGGTFTISNGGIYGSLLSTPIVNPPQSGVLGMHAIQDRPVARQGEVVIRPMMYVALTYDHRIIDGREAVGFLKHLKDTIEEPSRLLIGV